MEEPTTKVFLIGCRASGKTSFLGGLATLTRGGSDSPFQLVTRDGPTARVVTDLRSLVEQQSWPPPTSSMTPLTFELAYQSPYGQRHFNIALLDYPGEDLLEAIETLNFQERRLLAEQFEAARYVLVIADPTQDLITPLTTDHAEARRRQDALVQAVGQLVRNRQGNNSNRRDIRPEIAVLVSKRDLLDGDGGTPTTAIIGANRAFLKNLSRLSSARPQCFLVSACGSTTVDANGRALPPSDPKPLGYEALFDWLGERHFWEKHGRVFKWSLGALAMIALLGAGYYLWQQQKQAELQSKIEKGSIQEVLDAVSTMEGLSFEAKSALDHRIDNELERINNEVGGGPTGDRLKELANEIVTLRKIPWSAHSRELNETRKRVDQAREEALFNAVKVARRGNAETALTLIAEYKQDFPNGSHREQIDTMYAEIAGEQKAAARGNIRAILVNNRESLASRAKGIRSYLKSYSDDPDAVDMERAAVVAENLSTSSQVRLRMKGCGFAVEKGERYHEVQWLINRQPLVNPRFKSDGKRTTSTFDQYKDVSFADWSRITIELWDLNYGDELMAQGGVDITRDLSQFDGKSHFSLPDEGPGYWVGTSAYVVFEVQWLKDQGWAAVPAEDLQAYGRFIQPGRDW